MAIQALHFRHWRRYFGALASELSRPALLALARIYCGRGPTPHESWRRGILLGADHLGDILYNTASFHCLAAAFPQCRWDYLSGFSGTVVLRNNPAINRVIPRGRHYVLASHLREGSYDVSINYNSSQYWKDALVTVLAGIPNRVGYVHKGFSGLVNRPVGISYPQPFAAYFRDLVSQITGSPPTWSLRPRVFPDGDDEAAARNLRERFGINSERSLIMCFLTSLQPAVRWPLAQFAKVIELLSNQSDITVLLNGSPEDREFLRKFQSEYSVRCHVVAGELSVLASVVLMRTCRAVLTLDSGPRHLANAAGIPVFYFRNLSNAVVETGSYLETEHDLTPKECGDFLNPDEQREVLSTVEPETVAKKILDQSVQEGAMFL